ncbi:MAG: alpha/beta fold hydrolase [Candidatus Berkiella sp.]
MAKQAQNTVPMALRIMQWLFQYLGPLMPNLMGRYAYKLWFTPTRSPMPQPEQIAAAKAKVSFITVDGLNIRLWRWGEGPAVLFLHGWGGRGTQISSFIEPLNQAGFQVVSFDMPAHGQSDGKQTNAFAVANTVSAVINQIDNLHSVITHSFGGVIFSYFYTPQLPLNDLVMICPPATLETALNQFAQMLKLPIAVQNYIKNQLKEEFGDDVIEKLSLLKNAAKITEPVLIVHDKDDDVIPFQDGQAVANVLQQGSFYETQNLGHRKILFAQNVVEPIVSFVSQREIP